MEFKERDDVPWEKSRGTKKKKRQYPGQINKTMQIRKKLSNEREQVEQNRTDRVSADENSLHYGWKETDAIYEKKEDISFTPQTEAYSDEGYSVTRKRRKREDVKPIAKQIKKTSVKGQEVSSGTDSFTDSFRLPHGWTAEDREFEKNDKVINSFETPTGEYKYTTGPNRWSDEGKKIGRSVHQISKKSERNNRYKRKANRFESNISRRNASKRAGAKVTTGIVVPTAAAVKVPKEVIKKVRQKITEVVMRQKEENKKMVKSGALVMSIPFLPLLAIGFFATTLLTLIPTIILAVLISTATPPDIVAVAQMECVVWESNIGGEKYKTWYGIDGNWCAMFVSYCAEQCGYIADGIMPRTASVMEMANWYKEQERFHYATENYEPKAGDIIFFQEGMSHVGIVVGYDEPTKTVVVIEGNTGSSTTEIYHEGSMVALKSYPLTYIRITGYGVPKYPNTLLMKEIETENVLCGGEFEKCA